jgi:hypothetical protein
LGSSSPSRLLQLRSPPRCRKCALRAAAKARGLVAFSGSILLRAAANALSALQQMHVVSSRLVRLGCWSPPVSSVFSARFVLQCSLCLHVRSLARAWFGLAVDLCVAARPLTSAIKSFVLRSSLFTLRGARYCASRHRQRRSFRPGQRCLLSQLPLCGAFVRSSVLPGTAPRGTDSVGSSDLASVVCCRSKALRRLRALHLSGCSCRPSAVFVVASPSNSNLFHSFLLWLLDHPPPALGLITALDSTSVWQLESQSKRVYYCGCWCER